ncbi:helix-turn-helix domain-containing protein [Acidimicrobiaceae bacterium USS-CC1]|uniref:Helix-turn-helix domain-containing protein n=1 Tax=Acidiferrimicrobium australe TaxID=2664430 RepID=A0ABW9QUJ1_9ACTN|nr:helix-turn-helix domain-containing protein [Acidiferrimicrobium australe]
MGHHQASLAKVRKLRALAQATVAEAMGMDQSEISRLERRTDLLLSTLRRFVNATGGSSTSSLLTPTATSSCWSARPCPKSPVPSPCWTPGPCHIRATTVGQTRSRPGAGGQVERASDLPERTNALVSGGCDSPFPS